MGGMSVPVELDALRQQIEASGPAVFLITVRDGARPHVVSADVRWDGDRLVVPAGSRTVTNVQEHPTVTLLWPAPGDDYSLIVDGLATVVGDEVHVEPRGAVRHRSVSAPAPSGHREGDDPRCIPVIG